MAVQTAFEDRQQSTAEALGELIKEVGCNQKRKKEQDEKGLDAIGYVVLCKLTDDGINDPDAASRKVAEAITKYPNWQRSEVELRVLRNQVTFALMRAEDGVEKVTTTVETLFARFYETALNHEKTLAGQAGVQGASPGMGAQARRQRRYDLRTSHETEVGIVLYRRKFEFQ